MFRHLFFASAFSLSCFAASPKENKTCPAGKKHYRETVRHIEGGGIGYENGYTTFEAFFASDPSQWAVTPFLDVRGHIFDNGKWAANAGVGLRALWGNRVYGINTYYDYRNAGHIKANQIGAGIETLGELFDFRINGYLPVGAKISSPYDPTFGTFSGNYMLISQKHQSAMKGGNAEFGFHFGESESLDFYAAAGPYYFIGEIDPATWGGKARISGTFKDILILEISDSYDRTFHNKFQGQISLSFSFGPKSKIKEQGRTCKVANTLNNRMLQPVDREEIIVIDKTRKNDVAIDPATGLPYFFVFVDNASSSDGTYESPYHTLAQAQVNSGPNDIIYVFPGDGTTTGMADGITLQASQKFWGSGISHSIQTSVGTISIPAQSNSSPTITNTNIDTEGNAITLAINNGISGFTIASARNDAIFGTDPQNLDISSCTFENTTTFPIEAIFSANASISITDNQFLNNTNGIALTLNGTCDVVCSNNTFINQTSISSVPVDISATGNTFTFQIENNLFNHNVAGSIRFGLDHVVHADILLLNNKMTNNTAGSQAVSASSFVIIPTGTTGYCSIVATGNTFSGNTAPMESINSIYLHTSGRFTTLSVTASTNTMSDNSGSALVLATPIDTLTLLATDNKISGLNNNGIAVIADGISTAGNITIKNNTITDLTNTSNGISIAQTFSNLDLTILNNVINGCDGTGILCFANEFTNMTTNIIDNTLSNCQNNGGNAASGISLDTYINLTSTMANNFLSDNVSPGVAVGFFTSGNPSVCLTLSDNSSNTDPGYSLTNPGAAVFNLSPCNVDAVNIGTINKFGSITPVQSCPEGHSLPLELISNSALTIKFFLSLLYREGPIMKIQFIIFALVIATVTLFGDPYRCKMTGNNLEADIIVIGGGAAGCIVMSELSENGLFSVLGIEGGLNLTTDPAIEAVGLPAFLLAGTGKAQYFWPGWNQTLPMAGLNGRTSDWTTGMLLGGGSSINGLYYGRGSNAVYSRWEGISGSANWSLDQILATFNALENYQGLTTTPGGRGVGGPVNVLQTPTIAQITSAVLLDASEAAFPFLGVVSDYNDPSQENCIDPRAQWFIDPTGTQRVSSATAYLNSTIMTPEGQGINGHKLYMLFGSVAVKILFDKDGRAKKVRYVKDGQVYEAKARKAVVLASGINSSKILQLSGIGPSHVLKNAGIKPVFINENVGKHLQNHPLIFITLLADPTLNGVPPGAPYAFTINNIYLPAVGGMASDPRMLQMLFEFIPATTQTPALVTVGFDLLNPVSEGSVEIQSDNPFQIAAADDGFYQDPSDLANMKSAVSVYIRALLDQLNMMSIFFKPILSDPINTVILSGYDDAVVEQYVKNNSNLSLDIHHFVSHCKMAPLDAGGVVDGNTRVYGTKNVYVADNSICPVIPDINTTAPAMMIGLRTSQILKQVLR